MRRAALLLTALLAGCSSRTPAPASASEPSPFSRPPGSPASSRVGFVEPVRADSPRCAIGLAPGTLVKVGERLVSRDRALRATALLEVEATLGRSALARIRHGRPGAKDEAVRPSTELRQEAEALPAAPGT